MIVKDCPFCHHSRAVLYRAQQKEKYSDRRRDVLQCDDCGLLYPESRMDEAEAAAYAVWVSAQWAKTYNYDSGLGAIGKRECLYRLIRSRIREKGPALDIGTSTGQFCHVLNSLGFEACGIDPDPNAVRMARTNGFKVFQGAFPDDMPTDITGRDYRLITLNECAGFFTDMRGAFGTIHKMTAPGGHVLIKMAQGTSAFYRDPARSLFARNGDSIQAFHTVRSLRHILTRSGFAVSHVQAYPENNLKHRFGLTFPGPWAKLGAALELAYTATALPIKQADRIVVLATKG